MASLKPFYINLNDLKFLLAQVNFVPLFEGAANSNGIVAFDGSIDAYSAKGVLLWNSATQSLTAEALALGFETLADLGPGFPQVSAPSGVRDVTGLHNNLFGDQAFWGTVDVPFRRDIPADFTNYVTSPGADYTPGNSVIDLMPRIISNTITTAGVHLLTDASGAYVEWDSTRYASDQAYADLIDQSGVDVAQLVEGAKIVAPVTTEIGVLDYNGNPLVWYLADYQASIVYTTVLAILNASSYGGLVDSAGGTLEAGEQVFYRPIPGGALVDTGQTYQPDVLAYKQLIDANVDFSAGTPAEGSNIVTTILESGYGLLAELGHIDFQNPGSGEYFIGSENPGVAPVNMWFAIFGQFFDHGLDFIGKGGDGTITIQLDPADPLYRAPGTNGPSDPGVTKMTVARATINGTDVNGDPNYVNHTSPFIDQSQTYGSADQITQLLREWVSSDGGQTYHAGMKLFDGTTLVDAWERRWPDGSSTMVHDTLPTLNELRAHLIETGRDDLTWEDVGNYRNRDASGHVVADGDPGAGYSGHAVLLDMNPGFTMGTFDASTLSSQKVGEAVARLLAHVQADNGSGDADGIADFGINGDGKLYITTTAAMMGGMIPPGTYTEALALMASGWIDNNFNIVATDPEVHAAVGEILMASVGNHYVAGDGRVNENFGLTSIHHVFHEEHNYQVENLKSWIYQHDAHNPGALDVHEQLHSWQVDTGTQDSQGNFIYASGEIAWDPDKMFEATKLIVEMEYQHAAVDQYARTVTPRIQEFVGYSSGVDATISLEYAQVAFRFGHSTIRETIDAVDPSGWMLGHVTRYALEKAFLAPQTFAEEGIAAITLGLSHQQMNEVDEFVTPALTQGLLDMPLDLAAINIARGRDIGIPTLNDFREGISLARYTSWDDFGKNMIHPESLVNFIAAYSFGGGADAVARAQNILDLASGATTASAFGYTVSQAIAFLTNNTAAFAGETAALAAAADAATAASDAAAATAALTDAAALLATALQLDADALAAHQAANDAAAADAAAAAARQAADAALAADQLAADTAATAALTDAVQLAADADTAQQSAIDARALADAEFALNGNSPEFVTLDAAASALEAQAITAQAAADQALADDQAAADAAAISDLTDAGALDAAAASLEAVAALTDAAALQSAAVSADAAAAQAHAEADAALLDDMTAGNLAAQAAAAAEALAGAVSFANGADGFNHIDSWIGGLAEAHVPGGLLGETFDAVFVAQIQSLMDGDRFYYLYRLFGTNIHEEVNNGQFKDIVERNTGLSHLNGSIFAYADQYYDFNRDALPPNAVLHALDPQNGNAPVEYYTDKYGQLWATRTGLGTIADPFVYSDKISAANPPVSWALLDSNDAVVESNGADHGYGTQLGANPGVGIYSDGGDSLATNGTPISVLASDGIRANVALDLIRDVRVDEQPELVHTVEGTPTDGADSHEVIVATDSADYIHARSGDDTVYGEGGNDYIYGDGGVDRMYGGAGDDLIDTGEGPDLADGGAGKDIIYGRGSGSEVGGFDQLVGGSGNDLIVGGEGIDKLSGGSGDDIIYGDGLTNPEMGNTDPFTHGGDGNDYMDGGASGDLLFGEEGDDYIVGGNDQDLMQGGQGDDILRPGNPSQASGTTGGPDEVVGDDAQANVGFDLIDFSDYVTNAPGITIDFSTQTNPLVNIDQTTTFPAWFQIEGAIGTQNGDTFIGDSAGDATADNSQGNNWLIGGSGNDTFTGAGGNDLIVGGSIRLDTLIGQYAGADSGTLTLGSMAWIADAMQSGGNGTGYDDNTENAYTGATNRALGDIGEGLLANADIGTEMFDKHFTEMLRSRMFKDVVLGDGGADGQADAVIFTGNLSEYAIEVIDYAAASGEIIQALKVIDNGGLVDDGTGVLVPRANDGIDLLIGIEIGIFADQTISLIPTPPALDLDADHAVATVLATFSENFSSTSYTQDDGAWTADWIEDGDDGSSTSDNGQIRINGNRLEFDNGNSAANSDGAMITRAVDLTGATSATLSFSYNEQGFDVADNETVLVQFAADGSTFATVFTIDGNSGNGNEVIALSGPFGASSAIRFVVSAVNGNNDLVGIDNIVIAKQLDSTVAGAPGTGFATTFTENGARVAIASFPSITDDSATMAWAKVVLTDAAQGDQLRMGNSNNASGNLGGGVAYQIDSSVAGEITLTISGQATKAQYQGFIEQVRYFSTSDNPTEFDTHTTRTIDITTNDGLWTSNVATATISIVAIDDPVQAGSDQIVTSFASGTIVVPEWALLANDSDPDSLAPLDITGVSEISSRISNLSLATNPGSVTLDYNGNGGGNTSATFNYTLNGNPQPNPAVSVSRDTTGTVEGGNGNQILIGDGQTSTFDGGTGNDIILAGGGDDTIVWNANGGFFGGSTDGRDYVDGQDGGGDRFIVNGNNSAETFNIYTAAAAMLAGLTISNTATEIVITRNGAIIAELDNVEEITVNTFDVTANNGGGLTGGTSLGDTIAVFGDFTQTSLNYSTITINGGLGNDTVDIAGLTSDHRIVFQSNGGDDHIIGDLRPQDVVLWDDRIIGTNRADRLIGGQGDDVMRGLAGRDVMLGGAGNDKMHGGKGGDVFVGGDGADFIWTGGGNDNQRDTVRFGSTSEYGDTVKGFDVTGKASQVDRVVFTGALAETLDDAEDDGAISFAIGNGHRGTVAARFGHSDSAVEALLLTGENGEGVSTAYLGNAATVAAAVNEEFRIRAANGEDGLIVVNDTNGNQFSVWHWTQANGGEVSASELDLVGIFHANGTVGVSSFDFT
ncbi:MAG: peroxidase family protein [Hyphomicrobiaceae bacterium]